MKITTEEDLQSLIDNEIEENTNLDYKHPDSLKNKSSICKHVSAMANSNGGRIIYGLVEENKDHKPIKIEWLVDNQEKERIEQILQANVTPKIDVKITTIPKDKDSKKFALLVEVPKSDKAPHQDYSEKDRRFYWKRNGYTTREMEHYEVEGLFFKRKSPDLKLSLKSAFIGKEKPVFDICLENTGEVVAEKTYVKLMIPSEYRIDGWKKISGDFRGSQYQYILKEDLVYPELPLTIGKIYCPKGFDFGDLKINFLIVCKDMKLLEGEFYIDYQGKTKVEYGEPKYSPYSREMHNVIFKDDHPFISKPHRSSSLNQKD